MQTSGNVKYSCWYNEMMNQTAYTYTYYSHVSIFYIKSIHSVKQWLRAYVIFCAIWHNLCNLKNVKNTHGGALLLVKVTLLHGYFSRFSNCKNGTKSRNASYMIQRRQDQVIVALCNGERQVLTIKLCSIKTYYMF